MTIRTISRNTQGVRLINLEKDDKITSVAWIEEQKEEAIEEGKDLNGEDGGDVQKEENNEKEL